MMTREDRLPMWPARYHCYCQECLSAGWALVCALGCFGERYQYFLDLPACLESVVVLMLFRPQQTYWLYYLNERCNFN
jgi:hypothetical protein